MNGGRNRGMKRLVFIDDDQTELDKFRAIVDGPYEYEPMQWPRDKARLFSIAAPSIYVSDLYLPPSSGDAAPTQAQRDEAKKAAQQVAERFSALYAGPSRTDKERLQETMKAIGDARCVLDLQWAGMGQSPDNGIALCERVRERHPDVPFVFYSRKITPEDVIRVLRAGAVDAIRKSALDPTAILEILDRLASAQKLYAREDIEGFRAQGFNVNITVLPAR